MGLINILNPIPEINVSIGPPGYSGGVAIIGTLKRPPHKKQIAISWMNERSTGAAQIRINGDLTVPPGYGINFSGPGFWPPSDPNTAYIESAFYPDPPWDTLDLTVSLIITSVNGVAANVRLWDFKAKIKSHIDWLPILGIG
jgi:hypothetical protein